MFLAVGTLHSHLLYLPTLRPDHNTPGTSGLGYLSGVSYFGVTYAAEDFKPGDGE